MISEEALIEVGYKKQVFFYAIGGGEDENDMDIFVKDDTAVRYDHQRKCWFKATYSSLNYINGWPEDDQQYIETIEP